MRELARVHSDDGSRAFGLERLADDDLADHCAPKSSTRADKHDGIRLDLGQSTGHAHRGVDRTHANRDPSTGSA
jgi:hypothetical protein